MNKPKEEVIMTVVGFLICLGLEGDETWATALNTLAEWSEIERQLADRKLLCKLPLS